MNTKIALFRTFLNNLNFSSKSLLFLLHICSDMSVRQEKFAGLIQQHLAEILQRHKEYVSNVFVTVSRVQVSPDLGYAKVYLSLFKAPDKNLLLNTIKLHSKEIRKQLASKIKNQVRVIPELEFFVDDSLDYVFHMEEVFKQINKQDEQNNLQDDKA